MADYLNAIKKTPEELETELKPQAELRVKTSILARELYQQQKMEVTPDEVEKEIEEMLKQYGNNPDAKKQLETETYKEYLKNVIGNRKIMDYLKQIIIK
jgi:trigger factor